VDAPYPAAARAERWATCAYAYELCDEDHRRLADALHALRGMAVVSGYPCPLSRQLYGAWPAVTRPARTHGPRIATEVLWLSPRAAERLDARQLPLPPGSFGEPPGFAPWGSSLPDVIPRGITLPGMMRKSSPPDGER
jgi:DNA adenine methylase